MEWISVKDQYPGHKQKVKVKVKDLQEIEHELEATFNDHEEYRSWGDMKFPENVMIHAKPTHWMPLPKPPKE